MSFYIMSFSLQPILIGFKNDKRKTIALKTTT